jgi:hypothetical protein
MRTMLTGHREGKCGAERVGQHALPCRNSRRDTPRAHEAPAALILRKDSDSTTAGRNTAPQQLWRTAWQGRTQTHRLVVEEQRRQRSRRRLTRHQALWRGGAGA